MNIKCIFGFHTWEGNNCTYCGKVKPMKQEITTKKVSNWYSNQIKDKLVTQFIFTAPVSTIVETDFGSFMLPYDKFPILSSESWCSGFVRLSDKPIPYQMLRVGDFA